MHPVPQIYGKVSKIVVTGAMGFIGSCMVKKLNEKGIRDLLLSDDTTDSGKLVNLQGKSYTELVHRELLFDKLREQEAPEWIIHLGARTDTTENDRSLLQQLNTSYTQHLWDYCTEHNVNLIYASSAATYGDGALGYSDNHQLIPGLQPLNAYGWSKQYMDVWALQQTLAPRRWVGLKFFNVYGPNEYHKKRMASVVLHAYRQYREDGRIRLFRSHRSGIADGEQKRDFIYVDDVTEVIYRLLQQPVSNGIYNLGTGQAATFLDLAHALSAAMGIPDAIDFIDIPEDIRDKYQYYTCADMGKLEREGMHLPFRSIQEGVREYVQQFLATESYY